jgi:hypothetical protein
VKRQTGVIREKEEENEMKSFGMFSIIRGLFGSVANMIGGVLANKISLSIGYGVIAFYPLMMMLYTFLIFKEHKVSFYFAGRF